jgi:hypothetical protein
MGKIDVALLDQYTPIDVDTGGGTLNALPVTWRAASTLGLEMGTATTPVRVDPTGSTTQPVSGTVTANAGTGTLAVSIATAPVLIAGDANIGNVDIVTVPAPLSVVGTGTEAAAMRVTIATDSTGVLSVDDNGGALTVDGTVTANAGTGTLRVDGGAAHDAAVAGNPNLIAGRANLNEPTAVADGDATSIWADLLGRVVVISGHPNPEAPVTANGSAAGLSVIATPGANLSLYICKGSIHNRAAAVQVVSLRDGAAGTIRYTAQVAANAGGTLFDFGSRGWKLTANTALVADIAAASVDVNVTEYYIAA